MQVRDKNQSRTGTRAELKSGISGKDKLECFLFGFFLSAESSVSRKRGPMSTAVLLFADAPRLEITHSLIIPQEGQYLKLECVSIGNPM